jgi:hypothetical protein
MFNDLDFNTVIPAGLMFEYTQLSHSLTSCSRISRSKALSDTETISVFQWRYRNRSLYFFDPALHHGNTTSIVTAIPEWKYLHYFM